MISSNRARGAPLFRRFTPEDYTREETYRQTRLPVEYASTLIPDAYRSPEFYAVEQERVFSRGWVAVGCTAQVEKPGDVIVAEVAGQSVLVTRDTNLQLRAFYNVCRHRGSRLLKEDCHVRLFRCPYHSWAYNYEGKLLGTPLFEGSDIPEDQQAMFDMSEVKRFSKEDYGLLTVRAASWGFLVFVSLDPDVMPLETWLGDLPQRMAGYRLDEWQVRARKSYTINANWKLIAENFMEYYHLPWVHPELVKVSRMEDHYRYQGPGLYTGLCTTPISQDDQSGWLTLPPMNGLNASDAVSGRFIWLFPNVAISVLPNHAFAIIARPEGYDRTVESTYWLAHPDSLAVPYAAEALDRITSFWDLVNVQDIEIVEEVQRGLINRAYDGGRMCFRFEEPLHRFQNIVIDRMVGIDRIPPGDEREEMPIFNSSPSGVPAA